MASSRSYGCSRLRSSPPLRPFSVTASAANGSWWPRISPARAPWRARRRRLFGGAPPATVYALAAIAAVAGTAFGPAQSALLPSLARSAEELTAANATSTTFESVGFFVGPALGGLLLAVTSVGAVFTMTAALFLWSAFVLGRIGGDSHGGQGAGAESILREALAGFRAVVVERRLRILVGLYGAQTLAAGILRVLLVVTALQVLDLGPSGVGFLNSAIGIGALVGMLVMLTLIGTSRLVAVFGLGILLWGCRWWCSASGPASPRPSFSWAFWALETRSLTSPA